MQFEKLRELRLAHPFVPFVMVLHDGRRFVVDKPYYFALSPTKKAVMVATGENGAAWFSPDSVKETIPLGETAIR